MFSIDHNHLKIRFSRNLARCIGIGILTLFLPLTHLYGASEEPTTSEQRPRLWVPQPAAIRPKTLGSFFVIVQPEELTTASLDGKGLLNLRTLVIDNKLEDRLIAYEPGDPKQLILLPGPEYIGLFGGHPTYYEPSEAETASIYIPSNMGSDELIARLNLEIRANRKYRAVKEILVNHYFAKTGHDLEIILNGSVLGALSVLEEFQNQVKRIDLSPVRVPLHLYINPDPDHTRVLYFDPDNDWGLRNEEMKRFPQVNMMVNTATDPAARTRFIRKQITNLVRFHQLTGSLEEAGFQVDRQNVGLMETNLGALVSGLESLRSEGFIDWLGQLNVKQKSILGTLKFTFSSDSTVFHGDSTQSYQISVAQLKKRKAIQALVQILLSDDYYFYSEIIDRISKNSSELLPIEVRSQPSTVNTGEAQEWLEFLASFEPPENRETFLNPTIEPGDQSEIYMGPTIGTTKIPYILLPDLVEIHRGLTNVQIEDATRLGLVLEFNVSQYNYGDFTYSARWNKSNSNISYVGRRSQPLGSRLRSDLLDQIGAKDNGKLQKKSQKRAEARCSSELKGE